MPGYRLYQAGFRIVGKLSHWMNMDKETTDNNHVERESQHPIIIDIEASGFGAGSYPIEVGVAMPDGETECYLIKPEHDWVHWETSAEKVHQISRDTLIQYGTEARKVSQRLNSLLRGKTVYSDGWSKDVSWLAKLFESVDNTPLFRVETLAKILNQVQLNCWEKIKVDVIKDLGLRRHRASADALILQHTFQRSLAQQT